MTCLKHYFCQQWPKKTKIQATNIYTSAVSVVSILHKKFIITKKKQYLPFQTLCKYFSSNSFHDHICTFSTCQFFDLPHYKTYQRWRECQYLISYPSLCWPYNSCDFVWRIWCWINNNLLIDFLIHSHHLSAWYCVDVVRRNPVLVTHGSQRVNRKNYLIFDTVFVVINCGWCSHCCNNIKLVLTCSSNNLKNRARLLWGSYDTQSLEVLYSPQPDL